MTFGNQTVVLHLMKGILGLSALGISLYTTNSEIWPSLVLIPASLYLLWGCPVCWTMGLIETVVMRFHQRNAERGALSQGCVPSKTKRL